MAESDLKNLRLLQDKVDDAQRELTRFRWGMVGLVSTMAFFVIVLIIGSLIGYEGKLRGVDTGGPAGALVMVALFLGIGTAICAVVWWNYFNDERVAYTSSYDSLERAGDRRIVRDDYSPRLRLERAKRTLRDAQDEMLGGWGIEA